MTATMAKNAMESIYDNHPSETITKEILLMDEDDIRTSRKVISFPSLVTLEEIKEQARKEFRLPPDSECMEDHHLLMIYPEDGIDGLEESKAGNNQMSKRRVKNHHYGGKARCIRNEMDWSEAKDHWDGTSSERRDNSLIRFTAEVTEICSHRDLVSGDPVAGPHALETALRLCAIIGVPLNVTSLVRLRKIGLVYQAVVDLLEYHDPAAPLRGGGRIARAVADNCEPLVVACGAHLHWHLGRCSPRYRQMRTKAGRREYDTKKDGLPPKYENFNRLLKMGQSEKVFGNIK